MNQEKLKVAVVTGGHAFNVLELRHLFDRLDGVNAYVQHIDDYSASSEVIRDSYEVILFYIMMPDLPKDDGPGFRGKPKKVLEQLGQSRQGIVILHHGLLAYPEWPVWSEVVGIDNRSLSSYEHDVELKITIESPLHPITQGLSNWEMIDETYAMQDVGKGVQRLLTVDETDSMNCIAWTHRYKKSRVFCLQLGHDEQAWQNDNFQKVLERGLIWAGHKL